MARDHADSGRTGPGGDMTAYHVRQVMQVSVRFERSKPAATPPRDDPMVVVPVASSSELYASHSQAYSLGSL